MLDIEKFIKLFEECNIGFKVSGNKIKLEANIHNHVKGYNGFVTIYYFRENGDFHKIEIFE